MEGNIGDNLGGTPSTDDPRFFNPPFDYSLLSVATNRCIDAADNDEVGLDELDLDLDTITLEEITPVDLAGRLRVVDDPNSPNIGLPQGANCWVDMGAYEVPGEDIEVTAVGPRTIEVTPGGTCNRVALKVVGDPNDPDLACLEGYAEEPVSIRHLDIEGVSYRYAGVGDEPVYKTPAEWGTIYLRDDEIITDSRYTIVEIDEGTQLPLTEGVDRTWLNGDVDHSGMAEMGDIMCMIDAYALCYLWGACSSVCPNTVPTAFHAYEMDLCGLVSHNCRCTPYWCPPCDPWVLIEGGDISMVLSGYAGHDPCPTPCTAQGEPASEPLPGSIVITASPLAIPPGGTKAMFVYVTGTEDLISGYDLTLTFTGGTSGTVGVQSMEVDETRGDFLFHGEDCLLPRDELNWRLGSLPLDGSGAYAGEELKYLAKYVIVASSTASGAFIVMPRAEVTSLRGVNNQRLPWTSTGKTITVAEEPP